jgi:CubicO group peptidase (beta-lactamase class C family)
MPSMTESASPPELDTEDHGRTDRAATSSGKPGSWPTLADWDQPPHNRWTFLNMSQLFPTAVVSRGNGPIRDFPRRSHDLGQIALRRNDGTAAMVAEVLDETYTDGFLVLHRGEIVCEQYFNGMTAETRHLAQSVSKSVVGCLAGILVGHGLLDLEAPVDRYVPELARSGYAGATLSQVLDMRSGVRFREDYTDPAAEYIYLDMAAGWKERSRPEAPASIRDLLLWVEQDRPHGGAIQYRSIECDVVAWVCEAVTGKPLHDLVSEAIWSQIGAERDGYFTVDGQGTCLADGGFNATLRDYARFGQMCLNGGAFNGHQVVPADWIAQSRHGDIEAFSTYHGIQRDWYPEPTYSRQWWVLDNRRGVQAARGVFGQLIHVDPGRELVAVKLSTWPDFLNADYGVNTYRAIEAIAAHLAAT